MRTSDFSGASFSEAILIGARLQGASFNGSKMAGVVLTGADVSDGKFIGTITPIAEDIPDVPLPAASAKSTN